MKVMVTVWLIMSYLGTVGKREGQLNGYAEKSAGSAGSALRYRRPYNYCYTVFPSPEYQREMSAGIPCSLLPAGTALHRC
jgi:hypothetical protein